MDNNLIQSLMQLFGQQDQNNPYTSAGVQAQGQQAEDTQKKKMTPEMLAMIQQMNQQRQPQGRQMGGVNTQQMSSMLPMMLAMMNKQGAGPTPMTQPANSAMAGPGMMGGFA
jgi:ribosomal protein L16 Arg81 hydroxylase